MTYTEVLLLSKIISGGQTGVDRGALDAALASKFPCGGKCPRGRRAEDGPIPKVYPLEETPSRCYPSRTRMNVAESDGTLVIVKEGLGKGSKLTISIATKICKPVLIIDLSVAPDRDAIHTKIIEWLQKHYISVLNVAGTRGSKAPAIQRVTYGIVRRIIKAVQAQKFNNGS